MHSVGRDRWGRRDYVLGAPCRRGFALVAVAPYPKPPAAGIIPLPVGAETGDGGPKFPHGKWLGHAREVMLDQKILKRAFDHVTGHEEHLPGRAGIAGEQILVDLHAGKTGHFPVGDDHIVASLADQFQGGLTVGGAVDLRGGGPPG